jgi:hypothetical protein
MAGGLPVLRLAVVVVALGVLQAIEEMSKFKSNEGARMEKQAQELRDKEDAEMNRRWGRGTGTRSQALS